MNKLVLDLSYKPTIALITKDIYDEFISNNEHSSDDILLHIDSLLKKHKITINDIDMIAVNVGPGSFTGIRVAISIAKGLAFENNIKFEAFTSFDLVSQKENVILPAFSNNVYVKTSSMDCLPISSLDKELTYKTTSDELYEKLKNDLKIEKVERKKYNEIPLNKTAQLTPLYLRKSQAEIMLEKRKNEKK